MTGKRILQASDWTPEIFQRALEEEIQALADPAGAKATLEIVSILADHIAQLQVLGRFGELREYTRVLHGFLARHPDLTRLRDLQPKDQVGVRIDTIFQDLYAAERIPTTTTARDALSNDVRKRIVEVLVDANNWIKTPELVARCGLTSRQHLHQTLFPLREAGLVISSAGATNQHRATILGHQIVSELRKEEEAATRKDRRVAEPSLLAKIVRKNDIDPNSTGISQRACCPSS